MKKISILFSLIFITTSFIYAQAFEKGNVNVDLGLNLGFYSTTSTFKVQLPFLGATTVSNTDGAASFIVPIGFEYGISNKVGLGVQLGVVNYFINNEDSTETTESVKSVDFALKINYHLINSDKNDLFLGLALGGSSVNWKDLDGTELKGGGSYVSLYLSDRLFLSDHFGILFNLGYTTYNYTNITSNGNTTTLTWTLRGLNIGTGLAMRF